MYQSIAVRNGGMQKLLIFFRNPTLGMPSPPLCIFKRPRETSDMPPVDHESASSWKWDKENRNPPLATSWNLCQREAWTQAGSCNDSREFYSRFEFVYSFFFSCQPIGQRRSFGECLPISCFSKRPDDTSQDTPRRSRQNGSCKNLKLVMMVRMKDR